MKDWSAAADTEFLPEEEELIDFDIDFESVLKVSSSSSASSDINVSLRLGLTSTEGIVEEEELEWLSNRDAFPAIESCFGILSDNPELILTHRSPNVVLQKNTNSAPPLTCCSGFRVPRNPVRHRSSIQRKRRTTFREFATDQTNIENKNPSPAVTRITGRTCLHCGSDKTPQWRAGSMGPKTLCNACGVRYKSGRLFPEYRPANSPTFSSALHSNSHRKVVEMRKKQQLGEDGEKSSSGSGSIYSN